MPTTDIWAPVMPWKRLLV